MQRSKPGNKAYEILLGCFAAVMVFPKPATWGVIVLVLIHLLQWSSLRLNKRQLMGVMIISIPLLLDALFLWNNESVIMGLKNAEKHLSSLLLPLFFLAYSRRARILVVLRTYSVLFTSILSFGLLLHVYQEMSVFQNYLVGKEVWRMGYRFSQSLGVHAPALNMHVAFLVVTNTYLLVQSCLEKVNTRSRLIRAVIFLLSFGVLLMINTRLAIFNSVLGIFMVLIGVLYKKIAKRKFWFSLLAAVIFVGVSGIAFVNTFPYMIEKYTTVTFKHMDKRGRLDEIPNPEAEVYNGLVTRVSIWDTAWNLARDSWVYGVGAADARQQLVAEYKRSGQDFLYRHAFPTHNQYLDYFLKYGILGFLGILIMLVHQSWLSWRLQDVLGLFLCWLFFSSNLTDDFLVRFDGIVFWAFWFSLYAKSYYQQDLYRSSLTS